MEGNDYIKAIAKQKGNINSKKVIDLETLIIYTSAVEAARETGCNRLAIGECCRKEKEFSRSKITNQNIKWEYYSDYLNKQDIKLYA